MMYAKQSVQLDAQNPWHGLATYDETALDFLFCRETEVEGLLRLITLSPLTSLCGKSGLGESSLLQAGLSGLSVLYLNSPALAGGCVGSGGMNYLVSPISR